MALSKKLFQILKSKTNLTDKELNYMNDSEGWAIVYSKMQEKDVRPQICFTGFSPTDKEKLETFAISKDLRVVKSVTKGLNYLCCGDNVGPSKLEKAKKQRVLIINHKELLDSFSNHNCNQREYNSNLLDKGFILDETSRKISNFFTKSSLKVVFKVSNQSEKTTNRVEGSLALIYENEELMELTIDQDYVLNPRESRSISFKFPLKMLQKRERLNIIENYKVVQVEWRL